MCSILYTEVFVYSTAAYLELVALPAPARDLVVVMTTLLLTAAIVDKTSVDHL